MIPPSWLHRAEPAIKRVGLTCLHLINFGFAFHLFKENVGGPCFLAGPSMLPTLDNSGEMAIESILPHRLFPSQLGRGELVTLRSPVNPSRVICKRVIGLPGDVVCVDPTGLKAPSTEHVLVPKGHIWVAGDNAAWSTDSRDYGPVSMALVRGRIAVRVSAPNFVVQQTR
ncbi:peptidase S24/S26A/S26B/S26C [Suillus clintonianus]|uniref:peptidase S24/S26A/S26B/S26C n=1 Tax=Suillus clintonianus TaxID=1904413 RepID=UPI001B87CA83|nr:peptidase S24/S26A/S26B/S26C [Suillus clintonianus]KAG2129963.1 peptidase S24/S26A/S26B/S26C [Suillus clintonianus]